MENFKSSFQHKIELLIQETLGERDHLDALKSVEAIAEVLVRSTGSVLDAINTYSFIMPIPQNRVAVFQLIPKDMYIEASKDLDEQIAQAKFQEQVKH